VDAKASTYLRSKSKSSCLSLREFAFVYVEAHNPGNMARNFRELRAKMGPERQMRSAALAAEYIRRMELRGKGPRAVHIALGGGKDIRHLHVDEAIRQEIRRGFCIECGEPAKVFRAARNGAFAAHVEHFQRNPACSLSDKRTA
jgi:hypothetical protein